MYTLLAVEGSLFLSAQVGWFGFKEDKYTPLALALAAIIVPMFLMFLRVVASRLRRPPDLENCSFKPLRWYHATPDRLVMGLLALEGFLFAFDRFRWFALTNTSAGLC